MDSQKSKIFIIFHGRFPSEKAASLFAAKSAESFADLGGEVILLAPRRWGRFKQPASDFYGVKNNFRAVFLPIIDLFPFPILRWFAFYASFISFSVSVFIYLRLRAERGAVIYSNESFPLFLASFSFSNTAYEIHDFPKNNFFYRRLFARVKYVIATNRWKKEKLQEIFGIEPARIIAEPNAVSLEEFENLPQQKVLRAELNLPEESKIICYAGMLRTMGMEKGIDTALKALKGLPNNVVLLLVGGNAEDIAFYRKRTEKFGELLRVIFAGFVRHKEVALYLSASDVLIAPFPKTAHYEFYMSPMKIFEYMASGRPIVASNLESIREILGESSAILANPDDADSLREGIARVLEDEENARLMAKRAREAVLNFTWQNRATRILDFIGK